MQYSHWLKNWLNLNKPSVKKCTFKRYLGYARIISRYIGGRDLSEISPALLIKTAAEMSKTYAQSTVNAALSVIKRSISAAEKLGALKTHVEFPRRAFPRPRERKCLTLSDQKKLESFVELSRRPKLFGITLCLYTGLRVGELLALEWSDIDFASGTLKVGKTCRDVYENGGYKKELDSPKSFSSARTIPLPPKIISGLKRLKKCAQSSFVIEGKNGKIVPVRCYQSTFCRVLKKLGIPHMGIHSLRHTFATRALECGMDVKTLSEILGHSNPSITLNVYAHSLPEHKRAMMNKLVKYLQ